MGHEMGLEEEEVVEDLSKLFLTVLEQDAI